jgi:catechol 2,3-dioxygenase-like lactoylglutathione lyase family enzyme
MERAKAFYRDKLGLEPVQSDEGSARYQVGGTTFMVYPSEYSGTNKATAAGFAVADVEAAVAALRGRGVVFDDIEYAGMSSVDGVLTMPDGSKGAWFSDSEGNILGVFQEATA